jgi:hypothetical protein
MGEARGAWRVWEGRNKNNIFVEKPEKKRPLGITRRR